MRPKKVETLPVADDSEFRKKQMEHVVNGIKDMGEGIKNVGAFTKEMKTSTKLITWLMVVVYGIIFLLFGAAIGTTLMTTGIAGFFDMSDSNRYFVCDNGHYQDKMKTYADAKIFIEQFNGTCELKHYKVMDYG